MDVESGKVENLYNPKIDYHFCKFLFFDHLPNDEQLWRDIYAEKRKPHGLVEKNLLKAKRILQYMKSTDCGFDFASFKALYSLVQNNHFNKAELEYLNSLVNSFNKVNQEDLFFSILLRRPFSKFNQQMAIVFYNLIRIKHGTFPIIFYPTSLKMITQLLEEGKLANASFKLQELCRKTIQLSMPHQIIPRHLVVNAMFSLKERLIKEYDVKELYLYGSYARGEENQYSDVDVFVILKKLTQVNIHLLSFLTNYIGLDVDGKVVVDGNEYCETGKEVLSNLTRLF